MAKVNRKGRSKTRGRFVMLQHFMMETPAWRSLSPQDRAVYIEIRARYHGSNNGRIALSVRDAAERCNISKDTAAKCFRTLQDRGFIECAMEGSFSMKVRHATEWRLTTDKCDKTGALSSRAYQNWRPAGVTARRSKRGPRLLPSRSDEEDNSPLRDHDQYLN